MLNRIIPPVDMSKLVELREELNVAAQLVDCRHDDLGERTTEIRHRRDNGRQPLTVHVAHVLLFEHADDGKEEHCLIDHRLAIEIVYLWHKNASK